MEHRRIDTSEYDGSSRSSKQVPLNSYESSFSTPWNYCKALLLMPRRLLERMIATWSIEAELRELRSRSGGEMRAELEWYDVLLLGTGAIMGGGIFATIGKITRDIAGPAVILSYLLSGFSVLLSTICYTELAVDIPTAGGAFSYVSVTLGQFPSFLTGASLLLEYILGGAAMARNFSKYFSASLGVHEPNGWRFHMKGLPEDFRHWDLFAAGLVILLMALCGGSTKAASFFNMIILACYLLFAGILISGGFLHGHVDNLHYQATSNALVSNGFAPHGFHGVVAGAAMAVFSYIGYDSVATLAEECRLPGQALPWGLLGGTVLSTALFCLLATALVLLEPYKLVSLDAPFWHAFQHYDVFQRIATLAAAIGCITAVMMLMIAAARYITAAGRSALLPSCAANVTLGSGTPINATIVVGTLTAAVAYVASDAPLVPIVILAALLVGCLVAAALLFYRYHTPAVNSSFPTILYLVIYTATCAAFSYFFQSKQPWGRGTLVAGMACLLETLVAALFMKEVHAESAWRIPFMPWLPSLSIFFNIVLLGTIDPSTWSSFGAYLGGASVVYAFYSLHAAYDYETMRYFLPRSQG